MAARASPAPHLCEVRIRWLARTDRGSVKGAANGPSSKAATNVATARGSSEVGGSAVPTGVSCDSPLMYPALNLLADGPDSTNSDTP